ncbi:MAG: hypothetical protein JW388_1153 [Nitrospira sp.]|nr:hypothetical protein [Nitrospira sp.]
MRILELCVFIVALGAVSACSDFETRYFKDRVNEATTEGVAKRYGLPHKVEQREGGQTVWTYFERGSGTSSYAGTARSSFCRAYVLIFDRQETLRNWQQQEC